MSPIPAMLIVGFATVVTWIVAETRDLRALRIACVLVMFILVAVFAHALGYFGGTAQTSVRITDAHSRFMSAAVQQIDQGNSERVHQELRRMAELRGGIYESNSHVQAMDAAIERLQAP